MNRRDFIKAAAGAVAALFVLRPTPKWKRDLWLGGQAESFGRLHTGRTYYASPGGNDASDGLSPQGAWKSLAHVKDLQPGDRVYLSGVFREDVA